MLTFYLFTHFVSTALVITEWCVCFTALGNPVVPLEYNNMAALFFQSISCVVYGVPRGAISESNKVQPSHSPNEIICELYII